MFATECGVAEPNDDRQAVYVLRRVASLWGMAVTPVVYTLNEDSAFSVVNGRRPRQAYTALRFLLELVARLEGKGGYPGSVPRVTGSSGLSWPLMSVGLYGKSGSLLLIWQRTWAPNTQPWDTISSPGPGEVVVSVPARVRWAEVVTVRTLSRPATSISGSKLTLAVEDDIVAVRCSTTHRT
jgi:hypothetical protein